MRGFLTVLILLMTPAVLYFAYVAYANAQGDGGGLPRPPARVPWSWLAIAGGLLVVVGFMAYSLLGLGSDKGAYHPAQIRDGRIEEGYFDKPAN